MAIPTRHLWHKATVPTLGDIANVPNTQKKYREAAKMETQRNRPQMKKQEKSLEKELNELEASNLPETGVQNSGYKDAQRMQGKNRWTQ